MLRKLIWTMVFAITVMVVSRQGSAQVICRPYLQGTSSDGHLTFICYFESRDAAGNCVYSPCQTLRT